MPAPHLFAVMTRCACWAGTGQADCRPRGWRPHADFAPTLRSAGYELRFDPVTSKAAHKFSRNPQDVTQHVIMMEQTTYTYTFQVFSSPMLLYRLRCLFPSCEVKQGGGYFGVWRVSLRHKRTRCRADFEDFKGGAMVHEDPVMVEMDEAAAQDLLDLIELLCSNCCPHTCDGLVAGCLT